MSNKAGEDADFTSSADESIGRPAEWREGRYEKAGTATADQSVVKKAGEAPPDTLSTPVTEKDYKGPK